MTMEKPSAAGAGQDLLRHEQFADATAVRNFSSSGRFLMFSAWSLAMAQTPERRPALFTECDRA
jgi:hypothetical protein